MPGKCCKGKGLPDKPGVKVKGRGKVTKIRTIHPPGRPDKYIHVRVMSKEGPQGGTTLASGVQTKKETNIPARRKLGRVIKRNRR